MPQTLVVPVTRVRHQPSPLPLPQYMTASAAGMDVYADLCGEQSDQNEQDGQGEQDKADEKEIPPLGRALIPTGFALAVPDGYEAQVRPRSGLALRSGLTILNSPGTIDADYRDEVKILVINLGEQPIRIKHGERIAQLVVAPVTRVEWQEVDELDSTNRTGGFGHTGQ